MTTTPTYDRLFAQMVEDEFGVPPETLHALLDHAKAFDNMNIPCTREWWMAIEAIRKVSRLVAACRERDAKEAGK